MYPANISKDILTHQLLFPSLQWGVQILCTIYPNISFWLKLSCSWLSDIFVDICIFTKYSLKLEYLLLRVLFSIVFNFSAKIKVLILSHIKENVLQNKNEKTLTCIPFFLQIDYTFACDLRISVINLLALHSTRKWGHFSNTGEPRGTIFLGEIQVKLHK